jgi:hypothetical protein
MSDYNTNESVIYKIHCLDKSCDFVYFGSTTNYTARRALHKYTYNNIRHSAYNLKVYETIRTNGGLENWIMEIVEVFPCENKRDLCIREQWYIDSAKNKMNSYRSYVSEEQLKKNDKVNHKKYRLANKAELLAKDKQYRLANRDKMLEQGRQYRLAKKTEIKEYQKQYDLANKDKIRERKRLYYLKKKEGEKIETN